MFYEVEGLGFRQSPFRNSVAYQLYITTTIKELKQKHRAHFPVITPNLRKSHPRPWTSQTTPRLLPPSTLSDGTENTESVIWLLQHIFGLPTPDPGLSDQSHLLPPSTLSEGAENTEPVIWLLQHIFGLRTPDPGLFTHLLSQFLPNPVDILLTIKIILYSRQQRISFLWIAVELPRQLLELIS
ncbi:hypothetical protein SAMN04488511_10588 [Pedobacter suwonensis]|uniref:Uncharacterized protein n=1 Tax=Pedobacter suwonensis TaxID=332999 RepID=A0A1I0T1F0_9SPHI|nr:hypothetical protein SAMN04488511_10588 [Pedobacter suwonensis]